MSDMSPDCPQGEILLYTSPDGQVQLDVRLQDESLWMTQQMMAEVFRTSVQNIGQHVLNILQESELYDRRDMRTAVKVREEPR